MVVVAKKQLEQNLVINDAQSVNILGIEYGHILLFTATSLSISRQNSDVPRTIIGGVQLSNGEQKIYYRHSTEVKIIHASLNASNTLCCFVTRTEKYEVYIIEIGTSNMNKFSYPTPVTVFLGPYDVILLFDKDTITSHRMLQQRNASGRSSTLDLCAELRDCIYYQWDTLLQRLHIVKKRPTVLTKTVLANGEEPFVYTSYTINARGQLNNIMKIDFDLRVPQTSLGQANFEILSSESSLFLCWQLTMEQEATKTQYAVVSFGHGRTFYLSPSLRQQNREQFESKKIHFGLLDGDYVFAILRGEFIHALNFNIQFHFLNNLIYENDSDNLPHNVNYTTQRGLMNKISTLLYEKESLVTYTLEICPTELIRSISSTNIYPIISYSMIASKDVNILQQILEKILFQMYDDLNTKAYLKEILTSLIYMRIAKRHSNKFSLAFMATTADASVQKNIEVKLRDVAHGKEYNISRAGTTGIDQEYYEKLRTSLDHVRSYRYKITYFHTALSISEEQELQNLPSENNLESSTRTGSKMTKLSKTLSRGHRPTSPRHVDQKEHRAPSQANQNLDIHPYRSLIEKRNAYLSQLVSDEFRKRNYGWDGKRIEAMTSEYVQATQTECNFLVDSFVGIAQFRRAECLSYNNDHNSEPPSVKYKSLLTILEKLYLAVLALGFAPTEKLQKTLLEVSFCVMSFHDFVAAIDQNIIILTQEFVEQVISELNKDDPKSYSIKEQLIFMLPNSTGDLHSNLFESIQNNSAKCMSTQILVTRSYATQIKKSKSSTNYDLRNELENLTASANTGNSCSRLVEQAIVSFYRDCCERNNLDTDELRMVKRGLLTLTSPAH